MLKEKLCNDDVNRAPVLFKIIGENQWNCKKNVGYCIKNHIIFLPKALHM